MPCEPQRFISSGQKECVILQAANKHHYAYQCRGGPCDPDIAVDDDKTALVRSPEPMAGFRAATLINLGCSSGDSKAIIDPENMNTAAVGDSIQWRGMGDNPLNNFKVTLEGGYSTKLCSGGKTVFRAREQCKLLKLDGAISVPYTVTSDNCRPGKGEVTPQ